jgi:hypothetical protein
VEGAVGRAGSHERAIGANVAPDAEALHLVPFESLCTSHMALSGVRAVVRVRWCVCVWRPTLYLLSLNGG